MIVNKEKWEEMGVKFEDLFKCQKRRYLQLEELIQAQLAALVEVAAPVEASKCCTIF